MAVGDRFGFDGKRVLVVGGATGMGAAAAQTAADLGAELTVLDVAPITYECAASHRVDLSDKASVDAVLGALTGPFHAVFSCAGIAGGPTVMTVNFIAQRHIIDDLVATDRIARGGAVAMISSIGGLGWQANLDAVLDFLAAGTWEGMEAWVAAHEGTNDYSFSKMAMNAYVAQRAIEFARRGLRINAVLPGATDTPLARANPDTWLPFAGDYREATGLDRLTPQQMGDIVAFLCMDAASGMNGATVVADQGYTESVIARTFDSPVVTMMIGAASPAR